MSTLRQLADSKGWRYLQVIQDGREFYDDATGDVVFQSSIIVKDMDLDSAQRARIECMDWADKNETIVEFV